MRTSLAILVLTLLSVAPPAYGRGGIGHARGSRSGGYGAAGDFSGSSTNSVHVHGYTKKNGTVVQDYDRSAPGTLSGKSKSAKSSHSTNNLLDDNFSPAPAPKGSQISQSAPAPLSRTVPANGASNTTPTSGTNLQPSTQNGNQTTPANTNTNTLQFVNGWPFWVSAGWTDPETLAMRRYAPLVANARNLIRVGVYPAAVNLLQRVITGAPGTRIAAEAQRLLATIPTL